MTLQRIKNTIHGMFGVLIDDVPFAVTLELPWLDNKPFISCIPSGNYICKRYHSDGHPNTFQIVDVPERSGILFHIANTIKDLQGCIGVAEEFGVLKDKPAVLSSGRGFSEFMNKLHGLNEFPLYIIGV